MPPKEEELYAKQRRLGGRDVSFLSRTSSNLSTDRSGGCYKKGETQVLHTTDGAPYVICNSSEAFVNPTSMKIETDNTSKSYHEAVNQTLNLNLGLPFLACRSQLSKTTLWVLAVLDTLLFSWCEPIFFCFWSHIMPLAWKRWISMTGWAVYATVHKAVLGKRTGLHPSVSSEYHALTTALFWAQFFVLTPSRMRFSLGQMHTISLRNVPPPERVQRIDVDMIEVTKDTTRHCGTTDVSLLPNEDVPDSQKEHCRVRGMYIHCTKSSCDNDDPPKKKKVLFWIYGGAYLAGDVQSNSAIANEFALDCQLDVFIPEFRLAPQSTIDDVLWDICLAYLWVLDRANYNGQDVCLLGISSGGALALRLLQLVAERHQRHPPKELTPSFLAPLVDKMTPNGAPKCALMFGPYIDYTEPKKGSFLHYAKHDLIVSEAVQHYGLPYLNDFIPCLGDDLLQADESKRYNATGRRLYSPSHRSMAGMAAGGTSLCFIVSEHEVTYDMTCDAANDARAAGCDVTVAVWKFMCHTWSFLQAFIPEGRLSMEFAKEWLVVNATGSK